MPSIRLKALEQSQGNDLLFQIAKSLLTDWQILLTELTNTDKIRWANPDANCFTCRFCDTDFSVEEWPEGRIVRIGKVSITSYDFLDYGSDKLLAAIQNQKKRLKGAAERTLPMANSHFLHCE